MAEQATCEEIFASLPCGFPVEVHFLKKRDRTIGNSRRFSNKAEPFKRLTHVRLYGGNSVLVFINPFYLWTLWTVNLNAASEQDSERLSLQSVLVRAEMCIELGVGAEVFNCATITAKKWNPFTDDWALCSQFIRHPLRRVNALTTGKRKDSYTGKRHNFKCKENLM